MAKLPEFIIAGAPRSGTTWLYHLLNRHPFVSLANPVQPEPKFFLIDELYNKGISYYKKMWFDEMDHGQVCGEKTTNYLENVKVPFRIQKHIPDVKLIFLLREPVSRAYSNYLWSRKNGYEQYSFEKALSLECEREKSISEKLKYARPHAYFSRGLYAKMLYPYLQCFPRKNILILKYESILDDSKKLVMKVHRFLDLSIRLQDLDGLGIINASNPDAPKLEGKMLNNLIEQYEHPNAQLFSLLQGEFQLWNDKQ